MVQRLKRSTFEKKLSLADDEYLNFERTLCVLFKLYGREPMAECLLDMAALQGFKTFKITDEEADSYDGFIYFSSPLKIIEFVNASGYMCSLDSLIDVCDNCEFNEDMNGCFEERHLNCELIRSKLFELIKFKPKGE